MNYLAVLVAALAAFGVGALWYSFLFQKPWMELMGFDADSMRSMPLTGTQAMGIGFVTTLVMVYVLAIFVSVAPNVQGALMLAFWLWLGFTATVQIGSFLWEGKPIKLFLINASQTLVAMLVAALILVLWR
ncbi:MAG: DUF1761 domain-containing protein [Patescibacteria group bacterium]